MRAAAPCSPLDYVASARARPAVAATSHTSSPVVTGTSVVAFKFRDGIVMATDCLASYGSLARFRNEQRMLPFGNSTVLGAAGDISDFQYIARRLNALEINEYEETELDATTSTGDATNSMQSRNLFAYLKNLMYSRRSKINYLWNTLVVAGLGETEPFLATIDMRGVSCTGVDSVATGYGAYLAIPQLRQHVDGGRWKDLDESSAVALAERLMRVLHYRDARSSARVQIAVVTPSKGVTISEPREISTDWAYGASVRGYGRSNSGSG